MLQDTVKYIGKQIGLVLVLMGGVILLWALPPDERYKESHHTRILQLGTELPPYEVSTFLKHVETRLPYYREDFEQAGKRTGIPWVLLAAMAYQESKWDRHAKSPTGVRGLMMLTRSTASDLGITNRLDPQKSISGGARYLSYLHKRVPSTIRMPDRMFVALAAYNVGMGHVKDARILARRFGKNSNRWEDLKAMLPLLSKKRYYQTLPHRYARGWEPVQYVERIRKYHKILQDVVKQEVRASRVEI